MVEKVIYKIYGKEYVGDGRFHVYAEIGHMASRLYMSAEETQKVTYNGEFFVGKNDFDLDAPKVVMEYVDEGMVRISNKRRTIATGALRSIYGSLEYVDDDSGAPIKYEEISEVLIPVKN